MVLALCVSRDGSLWIGTYGSGLILHQDGDRTLWVGTLKGLYRIRKGVSTYVPSDISRTIAIRTIHAGLNGEIWIGHTMGLGRVENDRLVDFGSQLGVSLKGVSSFAETPDRSLWFGATSGLYRLKQRKVSALKVADGLASDTVRALRVDNRGTLGSAPTAD